MICPRTGANCPHGNACGSACGFHTIKKECGDFNLFTSPPKPSLEEIERLVDEFGDYSAGCAIGHPLVEKSRAALMAAIRAYGEG